MNLEERYLRRIHEVYPDLRGAGARLIETGQYNDALVLDEELIFRFPRFPEGVDRLEVEIAVLKGIRRSVSLAIPDPIWSSLETGSVGLTFAGYRMIPGKPLLREVLAQIGDNATLNRMALQLGTFLRELHAVSVDQIGCRMPVPDVPAHWNDLYSRIRSKLYPQMNPEAGRQVSHHFESFLSDRRNLTFQPVLTHGDFGSGNLLFDPKRAMMTGIIDFGFAGLNDPALDLAGLSTYGEPFLVRAAAVYPQIEELMHRIRFYRGTFALQEALYGVEHADREAFRRGIATYG
ncbi:MAG: phosphotransferase family protein [Dehalococcoidia bacterium]